MSYIDLSALMGCSLEPLQIESIEWTQEPIVEAGSGRIGSTVKAEGRGFVQGGDEVSTAAAITSLKNNSMISGGDFNIYVTNGVAMHTLLGSDCYDGGPHISFTVLDTDGGNYRSVKFTVTAKCYLAQQYHSWKLHIATAIDGLQSINQEGTVIGTLTGTNPTAFFTGVLATFNATYPPSQYLTTQEATYSYGHQNSSTGVTSGVTDLTTRYRINGVQLASSLPAGGSAMVVDGEVSQDVKTDEQHRVTTITRYELQLKPNVGDYTSLVNAMRPAAGTAGNTQLISESVRFSKVKAWKLVCEFTQLGSADDDGLLNYSQTVTYTPNDTCFDVYTYPGVAPIAVAKATTFTRITQSGSMTALGEFVAAPDPLMDIYDTPPLERYTDVSDSEKRTEWEYSFLDTQGTSDVLSFIDLISRPSTTSGVT